MQFTLPNSSRISLNYMANYDDAQKYLGVEFDFIGVDELTKHEEKTINFLRTRLRSGKGYPTQFCGTSNPGGIGHLWVKKKFIDATFNGDKIVISRVRNRFGETFDTTYRYIKSTIYDNPYLRGSNYEATLLEMPEHLQELYLYGNWDVAEGQFLTNFIPSEHIYDEGEIEIQPHWKCWIHMDWGHNDNYEIGITFVDDEGYFYTDKELSGNRTDLEDIPDVIEEGLLSYGFDVQVDAMILPHDMFRQKDNVIRDTRGEVLGNTSAEVLESLMDYEIRPAPNRPGIRVEGWRKVHRLMHFNRAKLQREVDNGMLDPKDVRPRWRVNRNCVNLIEQCQSIIRDPDNPEDIEKNQEDHAVDMIRYFAVAVFDDEFSNKPKKIVNKNTMAYRKKQLMERNDYDDQSPLYGMVS